MNDNNIINFKPRPHPPTGSNKPKPPPMFNIPVATKFLAGFIICIHIILTLCDSIFSATTMQQIPLWVGFTPISWVNADAFTWITPLSLITFSFVHSGWMHLAFNVLLLVAMGSGLEKMLGIKRYVLIYIGTTFFSALTHFALYTFSDIPIIGASGGVSGIFGAMLVLMNSNNPSNLPFLKNPLVMAALVYIGISVAIGFLGAPDGSSIAWAAHIGGFLCGIAMMLRQLRH